MATKIASTTFSIIRDIFMPRPHVPASRQTPQDALCLPSHPISGAIGAQARHGLTRGDMQLMTIKLATMIRVPIQHIEIMERYGSVFLISFIPHGQIDPVLPITAVPLGHDHDYAYMRLAGLIQVWTPQRPEDDTNHQTVWYQSAQSFALRCAAEAAKVLPLREAQYYAQQLLFTVANPDRRQVW